MIGGTSRWKSLGQRQSEGRARLEVHQCAKLRLGDGKVLLDRLKLAHDLDHRLLVAQNFQWRTQALLFDRAGVGQRAARFFQNRRDGRLDTFARNGLPIRGAHLLRHGMHHAAAALAGDQGTVGLLVRLIIADAEIQHVPGHDQVGGGAFLILADRGIGEI